MVLPSLETISFKAGLPHNLTTWGIVGERLLSNGAEYLRVGILIFWTVILPTGMAIITIGCVILRAVFQTMSMAQFCKIKFPTPNHLPRDRSG